jgi:hypothetical protein
LELTHLGENSIMNRWRKLMLGGSALAMAMGGMAATATPAQAAGSCPSGYLCLWEGANYSGIRAITASTNACVSLSNTDMLYQRSYISHLPVKAVLWQQASYAPYDFFPVRTLPAGGFSSNFGEVYAGDYVCTNGKTP